MMFEKNKAIDFQPVLTFAVSIFVVGAIIAGIATKFLPKCSAKTTNVSKVSNQVCANFASLVENSTDGTAICKCDQNYLPFNDVCIMCSGVGAFVNEAGQCSCDTGAMPVFINNLVQCVCPDNWVQSGDTCFQCNRGKISV